MEPPKILPVAEALANFRAASEATIGLETQNRAIRRKVLREYWSVAADALQAIQYGLLSNGSGASDAAALMATLQTFARYLAVGDIPAAIADVAGQGRKSPGPTETRHIRAAVKYRVAVQGGIIHDDAPTKTIEKWFGVDETTAQGWFRDYAPLTIGDDPSEIERITRESGEFYSAAGRSSKAISLRARARNAGDD